MTDHSILLLLEKLREQSLKQKLLQQAGVETDGYDGGLFDVIERVILNELGFPQDNTRTVSPSSKKYFCRDWLGERLFAFTDEGACTAPELLQWLRSELAELTLKKAKT